MPYNFQNNDLREIWLALGSGTFDPANLAQESTLQTVSDNVAGMWDGMKNLSASPSVFKDPLDDTSWFSKINDNLFFAGNSAAAYLKYLYDVTVGLRSQNEGQYIAFTRFGPFATLELLRADMQAYYLAGGAARHIISTQIIPNPDHSSFSAIVVTGP